MRPHSRTTRQADPRKVLMHEQKQNRATVILYRRPPPRTTRQAAPLVVQKKQELLYKMRANGRTTRQTPVLKFNIFAKDEYSKHNQA